MEVDRMTQANAIHSFFNQFGVPAYPITAVPDEQDISFPYLTYEPCIGFYGEEKSITVNLWYKTESEAVINKKATEIVKYIGMGGCILNHEDGITWIKLGTPSVVAIAETDPSYKRRVLNIEVEFQ